MLYFYNMSIHDQFDATFKALASPVRRQILDDLKDQPLTTGMLCSHFADIDRCTVMQHLKVLEAADLIIESMQKSIASKRVTYDFARLMEGATQVSCSGFGQVMIENM